MTTAAYAHDVGPGETLVADVSLLAVPFGWSVDVRTDAELSHDFSISEDPGDWLAPATNASITADATDAELDPVRFLRWRHTSGGDRATVRIAGIGRVAWSVSS